MTPKQQRDRAAGALQRLMSIACTLPQRPTPAGGSFLYKTRRTPDCSASSNNTNLEHLQRDPSMQMTWEPVYKTRRTPDCSASSNNTNLEHLQRDPSMQMTWEPVRSRTNPLPIISPSYSPPTMGPNASKSFAKRSRATRDDALCLSCPRKTQKKAHLCSATLQWVSVLGHGTQRVLILSSGNAYMFRETIQPVRQCPTHEITVTRIHAVLLLCTMRNTAAPYAVTLNERIVEIHSNPACFREIIGRNQHVEVAATDHSSLYLVSSPSDRPAVQRGALRETNDTHMAC
jgi:hypothetical protein